jgi:hypothetical protein
VVDIEDRKGFWREDRIRFQQRCATIEKAISFIFDEIHRGKMRIIVNLSDTISILMPITNPTLKRANSNLNVNISHKPTRMFHDIYIPNIATGWRS